MEPHGSRSGGRRGNQSVTQAEQRGSGRETGWKEI